MRHVTILLFLLSIGNHPVSAQTVTGGKRVRITSAHYALQGRVGRVLSETPETIVVRFHELRTVRFRDVFTDDTLTLARTAIDRLEVSGSAGHQTKRGALIGLGIGASVGFAIGYASYRVCDPQPGGWGLDCLFKPTSPGQSGMYGAARGALVGVVVGTVIGTMVRADRWVTVTPQGLGLAISF